MRTTNREPMTEAECELAQRLQTALDDLAKETTLPLPPTAYGRGWVDASASAVKWLRQTLVADVTGREPNHYAWFMPDNPMAAVDEYLDDFEAKLRESLTDFYVHDMAHSVLPLIAAYRELRERVEDQGEAMRHAVYELSGKAFLAATSRGEPDPR